MALALAALTPRPVPAPEVPMFVGLMQRYAPGRMAGSVAYQIGKGNIPPDTDVAMAVAVTDCSLIGHVVWLEMPDGRLTGPHTVADCSAPVDLQRHLDKGIVVEVSFEYARLYSIPIHGERYWLPLDGPLEGVVVWPAPPEKPWYCSPMFPCN